MNVKPAVKVTLALLVYEEVLTEEQADAAYQVANERLAGLNIDELSLRQLIDVVVAR